MRGTDLGPWLGVPPAPAARLPPAFAEVEDKRMVVGGTEKLLCDLHWGSCAYYDLAADPREQHNLAEARPERAAALRGILDHWLDGHVRFEPLLAKGASNPKGGPLPKAIERGRLGDLLAGPELAAIMTLGRAARRSGARRRSCWSSLPRAAGDGGRARARGGRHGSRGRRLGVGRGDRAWATRRRARACRRSSAIAAAESRPARARGAGAGRGRR